MNGELSQEEILRYSRHLILPEVGIDGQKKIKKASVIVIGSGGLGSPVLLYLAAAGVGRIGIVDFDKVDETNLQRQIIHSITEVGKPKVESAKKRILDLNPLVNVETYNTILNKENATKILSNYDVIIDGTDNFPTRYLLSDLSVWLKKPLVYASIFRFEGQVSVFDSTKGPCYRCLFPTPPPPGEVPSCAEGGVLGVLPGVIGVLQSLETLKIILNIGEVLIGKLLIFNALDLKFHEVEVKKDPDCPVCGVNPSIFEPVDYEEFCGAHITEDVKSSEYDIEP
ncbi:MAG: molybdopterin-synthase adenylyltransferase MoeB, partial [Endomicrobia bacterium]|nr:molybdopterin-synthase adenylyltransferase MoeB [Endomicrobiia bacterium]